MSAISTLTWRRTGRGPQTAFNPPRFKRPLTFTHAQLVGSFARAAALSHTSPTVIQGLTQAFDHLLTTLVEPGTTDLTLKTDVESLSDSLRVAFSGFLGAAVADLLMMQLGYALRCNGRELLKTGPIFDLAYDSGPLAGSDIVAVEAKGRLRSTATLSLVSKAAEKGYRLQVEPFLGGTMQGGQVVHGYSIGTGSQLKQGVACHMHVEETGPYSFRPPAPAAPTLRPVPRAANGAVVLGNFRAVTRLLGGGGILEAIDAGLRGEWQPKRRIPDQYLSYVSWQNQDYMTILPARDDPQIIQDFQSSFGVRLDAAERFLNGLSQCIRQQDLPDRFPLELLVRPFETALGTLTASGGAEFADGLTYFGRAVPASADAFMWSPDRGVVY